MFSIWKTRGIVMLKEIYIENLAVIEKSTITFSHSFNAFTGETGAGKSILINGINAILGQRITKDIVRTGCQKSVITALFCNLSTYTKEKLDELGIDYENNELTITREIYADGGSIARINSRATTISVLKEIGGTLINIHGQHDNQILLSPEKHMQILDKFSGDLTLLNDYRKCFKELQHIARTIKEIYQKEKDKTDRIERLEGIIEEIGALDIDENEDNQIENEYNLMKNSDRIINSLKISRQLIDNEDSDSIMNRLLLVENELSEFSDIPEIENVYNRIISARIELEDITSELTGLYNDMDFDEQRFGYITQRLSELNSIKKKYGGELSDIIKLYNDSLEEIKLLESNSDELKKLNEKKEMLLHEVTEKAKKLSQFREKTAEKFVKQVTEELKFLDMPNVVLEIAHEKGKLTVNGMDNMEIMISANKGEPPKPISKIASGGELSRIMLALKNVIADKDDIPTLIFDEIDTGVSGRAAQKIGIKLHQISKIRQVLCVTHLAQIAVMADNHLLIEKQVVGDRTITQVKLLDFEQRKHEIARIMSGENPSELMLKNAEELLKFKFEYSKRC